MSKRRRQRGEDTGNLFNGLADNSLPQPEADSGTLADIANAAYGSNVGFVGRSKTIRAKPISIFDIYPDLMQPRRVVPSALRQYWQTQQPADIPYLFERWREEVELERGSKFDLDAYLTGETAERVPREMDETDSNLPAVGVVQKNPLETAFLYVVDLAASIYRDGLTNPITVAEKQGIFTIETGERRWLAYHLLHTHFGELDTQGRDWSRIPSRIVDTVSIWRQASENNARADLNAVGKARQLALLLMDLLQERGTQFQALDAFENEREFYAQVADGEQWSIPRGMGETVLNAMGLKNAVQLRQHRRLLRLPDIVWLLADDLNWSENFINKTLLSRANSEQDTIRLAIQQAQKTGYTVSSLTLYDDLLHEPASNPNEKPLYAQGKSLAKRTDKDRLKRLMSLGSQVRDVDIETREELLDDVQAAEAWLRELREWLT